jgi:hypothetical protein
MMRTWKWLAGLTILALVATAVPAAEPGDVTKQLDQLQAQIKLLTESVNALRNQQADIDLLKRQVLQLQQDLASLRGAPRVSAYAAPATTGRVQLINTYPLPRTVILNGRSYRLPPGSEQFVDNLPAGPFSFEVLEYHLEPQVRTLAAGQTYTITVFPR